MQQMSIESGRKSDQFFRIANLRCGQLLSKAKALFFDAPIFFSFSNTLSEFDV